MKNEMNYKTWLLEQLHRGKERNPAFSLRALAKKTKISHTTLSEVIAGKRPLTKKMIERLDESLSLDPETRNQLLGSTIKEKFQARENPREYHQLQVDEFHLISQWYHYAIRNLGEIDNNQSEPAWLAARLGISVKTAKEGFARLEKLGLVQRKGRGFVKTTTVLTTTTDVPSSAIKSFHRQVLEKASESLTEDAVGARDMSSACFAFSPSEMNEAKQMIQDFRREFSSRFSKTKSKKRIYNLAVQFFPLDLEEPQ